MGALVVLAALGLSAGTAAADPVPIPPLPPPPVTLPTAPAPVPSTPSAPQLPTAATPSAPVPSPSDSTQMLSSAVGGSGGAATGGGSAGGSGSSGGDSSVSSSAPAGSSGSYSAGSTSPSAGRPQVQHFRSSHPWIGTTGAKSRRTTTFTFVLPRRERVVFVVNQVAPACRGIGRFSVMGHAGVNRVRFAGSVNGRQLTAGTYRISARTTAGRVVRRITLVVSGSAPTEGELRAARELDVCSAATRMTGAASLGATAAAPAVSPTQQLAHALRQAKPQAAGMAVPKGANLHSGVLASTVERAAHAVRPFVVALLALAIVLLGIASLPRVAVSDPRVNELLARHRLELASVGAALLAFVVFAFLR